MGLIDDLGYRSASPNPIQKSLARMASTRLVSRLLADRLAGIDALALRMTGGRSTLSAWMAAQPVIWLTVIGRRSGERRRVPLTGIPFEQDIAVIGSYFGSRGHPAWALNLEATPEAEASIGDRTIGVRGRGATAAEEEEIWRLAGLIYPGYALYRERVTRSIKVFVLESARLPSER